jgi:hypothetical protein
MKAIFSARFVGTCATAADAAARRTVSAVRRKSRREALIAAHISKAAGAPRRIIRTQIST